MLCKKQSAIIIITQSNLLLKNRLRVHSGSGPSFEKSTSAQLLFSKIVKSPVGVYSDNPAPVTVEQIGDFWDPNPVKIFFSIIRSDPNPVGLSKYLIQCGLYPKKLWLSVLLQWSMHVVYPYLIRLSLFQNPVQTGSVSEVLNPVGSRSGDRIMFNTDPVHLCNRGCRSHFFRLRLRSWSKGFESGSGSGSSYSSNLRIWPLFRFRLQSSN